MLLHLDLKEPGLEPGVARLLDVTDTWDHVVSVNRSNATNLLQHPKLRLLEYKGPGLYDGRKDVDPASIEAILTQPGQMLLVDDPRVAVLVMRREPYAPRPLLRNLRVRLQPPGPLVSSTNEFRAMDYVRALNSRASALSLDALERLLDPAPSEVGVSARDDATGIPRAAAIVRRAWAAQRLATIGVKSRQTTKRLEKLVLDPTFHSDQAYSHLDGAEAAYALGELGAIESAGTLVKAFRQPAPDHLRAPWGDYRLKHAILVALGDLRCRKASKFLRQYTVMDEEQARQFGLPQWETATSALLRQRLMWDQVADLLRSTNLAVRGTAILACLDPLTEERRAAIRAGAQWVSALPRPKR
jgi:hypothetical protein